VLFFKSPAVSDMRLVDWKYIDAYPDNFPNVHENFKTIDVDKFIGQKLTNWNDELIMQFYSTAHFYPDRKIVWMTEGIRCQSTIADWAALIGAPESDENDIDVYAKPKMDHNSMTNIYTTIPKDYVKTHRFGSSLARAS
jgi:hypothetical protein